MSSIKRFVDVIPYSLKIGMMEICSEVIFPLFSFYPYQELNEACFDSNSVCDVSSACLDFSFCHRYL